MLRRQLSYAGVGAGESGSAVSADEVKVPGVADRAESASCAARGRQ